MKTLLTANLSTKTVTAGEEAWAPPVFTWGEKATLAVRITQDLDGETIEPFLNVTRFVAAMSEVDQRPVTGQWKLQIGAGAQTADNTTDALNHDATAAQVKDAIAAKTAVVGAHGAPSVMKQDGSWLIYFANATAAVPMQVRDNTLAPVSFGRITATQIDGKWQHEVRLIRTPVVFSDTSERVLPGAPTITRVRGGGAGVGYTVNEIQALYVGPDFRATYDLQKGFGRTKEMRLADTAATVQAALEAAFGAGNFLVTVTADYTVNIEYIGEFAGQPMDLLVVNVLNPPPGDLTFTLDFEKNELLALLRTQDQVTLPMDWKIIVEDEDEVEHPLLLARVEVTVRKPTTWPQLETVPSIDWLRPPSPKDYRAFNPGNTITGHRFYRETLGDGTLTTFEVTHGLDTEEYFVVIRENGGDKRQLVQGYDFAVSDMLANVVTITALDLPPSADGWVIFVVSAQTVAAFADGLEIEIDQVNGLDARLDLIEEALSELQDQAASNIPLGVVTGSDPILIELDSYSEVFPGLTDEGAPITRDTLPETGFALRPAIHDSTITSLNSLPLPAPSAAPGNVYLNNTGTSVLVVGGVVKNGEHFASDGKVLFAVTRSGTTNSFFPRAMERELFSFGVTEQMLRAGSILGVSFDLRLQMLKTNTRTQFVMVIEHGAMPSQTSPATTATNLENIVWDATPMLTQRVILDRSGTNHRFGVQILRNALGALSANKDFYNFRAAADAVPASANVAIRARLIRFDTENAVTDARGFVALEFKNASARITY